MIEKIKSNEYVVTAFAQPASGPGWANKPVVAVVGEHGSDALRLVYIQPADQTPTMTTMYRAAAACESAMTTEAENLLRGKR